MLSKKIMLGVAALGISTVVAANAYAAAPGFYLGGQLGWGKVHQQGITHQDMNELMTQGLSNHYTESSFDHDSKDTGLAGRLFAGYQFNENWATELGWTKFKNMTTKANTSGKDLVRDGNAFAAHASGTVKTDAIDLVAKGIYPIQDNINVYGKLGAAYLMSRADASASLSEPLSDISIAGKGSSHEHKFYPTFGVGVSYDFTPNVAADLSWNRIQKVGSSSTMASTDLVGVGLTYFIG